MGYSGENLFDQQLPGPFDIAVCTAFTPGGSSLNTNSTCTIPDQRRSFIS